MISLLHNDKAQLILVNVSFFKVRGDLDVGVDTTNILNCNELRDFWVGLVNNTIEVS